MNLLFDPPVTRRFGDTAALRDRVYSRVKGAYSSYYPIENKRYRLELSNVAWGGNKPPDYVAQKKAIINGQSVYRPLRGTWTLVDKDTGAAVDTRPDSLVANIPHITERGTFIYNGNEYTLASQMRMKAGVYTREKANGELESHFNVTPGTGPAFRIFMAPETGVFHVRVGQAKVPLYPMLHTLGVSNAAFVKAWGRDLLAANQATDSTKHFDSAYEKFVNRRGALATGDKEPGEEIDRVAELRETLDKMRLDPEVTRSTLGKGYDRVSPEVMLAATQKLIGVSRHEQEADDRDNIAYQTIIGPEDLLAERVSRGAGQTARNALWKATWRNNLDPVVAGDARTRQLWDTLLTSGLGQPLEEVNPLDIADQLDRVSRMGTGGIPSLESVPNEARDVQPSYFAFIDPVRTPESGRVGVDNRVAYRTVKGDDGQLYTPMLTRSGKEKLVSSTEAANAVIAFPGEIANAVAEGRLIKAMAHGRLQLVKPDEVDYEVASHEDLLSAPAHLVPLVSGLKGHRMLMATRMFNQALALRDAEAPFVQTSRINKDNPDDSFERYFGEKAGAIRADVHGVVRKVSADSIVVDTKDGRKSYQLYNNFPFNRKSFQHNTAQVRPGDRVAPGKIIASSNFTDANGDLALGKNLRIGYLPYRGMTFEDAIVISEEAAKKLTSEHMYQHAADIEPGQRVSKVSYIAKYPGIYPKAILDQFDASGVVREGTVVHKDDPLILGITKRKFKGQGVLHKTAKDAWVDSTTKWEHNSDGVVTDVYRGPRSINVVVKSYQPMEVGDKLANRFGAKGVVSQIVPNDQMPRDADGNPLEILMHPFGVISRTNPSVIFEAALGKIVAKTGKPYKLPGFSDGDLSTFVAHELKKHNMSDTENVFDPTRNRTLPNVFVGNQFWMKLHHTSEGKLSARGDEAGYTADMTPGTSGDESAKRLGGMEITSLLSHGATEVLRDAKLIRGQRNDDFWRAFRMGYPPPTPEVPFVYRKFMDDLRAAGINVEKRGNYTHIMAMTDKDIDKMSQGEITTPDTLNFDTMNPIPRGLFDLGKTGGHGGTNWSHIKLSEPMPSPVMEEPIRRLLGLTTAQFRSALSGETDIGGLKGGAGIKAALQRINVDKELDAQKQLIRNGPASKRDMAVKRLRTLTMFKKTGIKPEELVLTKVPVMPPQYRPIVKTSKLSLVSDPNYLYKELMLVNNDLADLTKELGTENVGDERLALYDTFKALTGLGDPIQPKLQAKHIRGILSHALGIGDSPKHSAFQRKVLGIPADLVGRGVITPNASLDMDQVGLPEEKAWLLYRPFIIKSLIRRGARATEAVKMVIDKDSRARQALVSEMAHRPVIVNRAPTMHRFGIMAAFPVLTKGSTLQVSPLTTSGFGADFDGDAQQFHVPVSEEAVREAKEKLLPSRNLTNVRHFDVNYVPGQEYVHGLWQATGASSNKPERVFASKQDAIRAYWRGEIGAADPVRIA